MDSDQDLLSLFEGLESPNVSDALDKCGIQGQCFGISAIDPARPTVVGTAYTVRVGPVATPPTGTLGDYLDDVRPGNIVMIDAGGQTAFSVWGDIITRFAIARKFGGTVIDGVCRDIGNVLETGYPMFSRGRFTRTGKGRLEVKAMAEPVEIGGVFVTPGDIVVADGSGVVVVPRAEARRVAEIARDLVRVESEMCAQIDLGKSMKDVWAHLATLNKA